jgi:hypothetical protein
MRTFDYPVLHMNARPFAIQFFGNEHGECCPYALAHFDFVENDADGIVGADPQQCIRRKALFGAAGYRRFFRHEKGE